MSVKMKRITIEFDNGQRLTCEVAQGHSESTIIDEFIHMQALPTTKWNFDAAQYTPPKEQQFTLQIKAQISHQKMESIVALRGDKFTHSVLPRTGPSEE